MLQVGLIGAGRIGRVHAQTIAAHRGSALAAVADRLAAAARDVAAEFGAAARSSAEILADPRIDAVLIASSTDTHCDLIEAAARAGKAVLCEKPVDLSLSRARDCARTVAGAPVMIGFNRRFDNSFAALRAALEAGEIGRPELLSITSFDPAPPPVDYVKVSGGLFRDMMIHDFDMANFLMGEEPEMISATASCLVDPEIAAAGDVDTAVVTLRYGDGRLGVIRNSRRAAYGYDQRVELLGSQGLLQAENMPQTQLVTSTDRGVTGAKPTYFFLERYQQAYATEWDGFVRALAQGAPLPVPLEAGVAALAMAEAAQRSLTQGRPVAFADVWSE